MLQISRHGFQKSLKVSRDVVQRFAELGYQLEPEALDIICSYPGSLDDLFRRIISSTDRSVAVIRSSQVSCLLNSVNSNDTNTNDTALERHAVSSQRHDSVSQFPSSIPLQSLTISPPQDSYA